LAVLTAEWRVAPKGGLMVVTMAAPKAVERAVPRVELTVALTVESMAAPWAALMVD
jgi:hypothetical protein